MKCPSMCDGGRQVEWRYSSTDTETWLQMDVCGQTGRPGHFTATEKALVVIELGAGWLLELACIFCKKRQFSSSVQDLYPRSSSAYPSYCTDRAATY